MKQVDIGFFIDDKQKVARLDLTKLIEGRALIQANSGGGKSYLLRKILEATNGFVQQIIIDPEGEYSTLREKFDNYILVGKDGDLPINLKSAEILAERLLELGANAIIDLYELQKHDRIKFVKLFLEALVNVDKRLWHDCLIVVDEAHIFAPEKGHGDAESLQAVTDLATRGRKRGFALIAATQRPAKFNKDVSAELNTKFVGRCVQDIDQARAADELGFSKQDRVLLRRLEHEFYCFGGAISEDVKKIKAGKVITNPPKFGQAVKVLTTGKIKDLLTKLSDLDIAADKAKMNKQELELKVKQLEAKLKTINVIPMNQPEVLQENYDAGYKKGFEAAEIYYVNQYVNLENWIKQRIADMKEFVTQMSKFNELPPKLNNYLPAKIPKTLMQTRPQPPGQLVESIKTNNNENLNLKAGVREMLKNCAMYYPNSITKQRLGTLSGFTVGGGTFGGYLSTLKQLGFVVISGDNVTATKEGYSNAGDIPKLPKEPRQLLDLWCNKLTKEGQRKMLKIVFEEFETWQRGITKEELGNKSGFTVGGGTFGGYLSTLKTNNLVKIEGDLVLIDDSFFEVITN